MGAPDFAACSGCSLCLLVCPVWRRTRDLRFTPHGRAKALQHGVPAAELADSVDSCTLCGACEPVCPENIDLVGMTLGLRAQLPQPALPPAAVTAAKPDYAGRTVLLAGAALRAHPTALRRALALLGAVAATDDGDDLALALESGAPLDEARRAAFLAPLRAAAAIVVADGLLYRTLARWQPRARVTSLGYALSRRAEVRGALRTGDLYVIEPRAFHADHAGRVVHYDDLRHDAECAVSLDLLRMAVPATARSLRQRLGLQACDDGGQIRWLLQGRKIARIVVEDAADLAPLAQASGLPVVHVAELANE